VLTLPVEGKGCRLLACEPFTRCGVTVGRNLSIVGRRCGAKCSRDSSGQASVFRETAAEGGKVATQLFNEPFTLKLDRLRIALEWAERLIKLLLTGAEATLRLFICRDLALNLNLQGRLHLHALFTLRCGGASCGGETGLLGKLCAEIRDARLECTALLCGPSDSSRGAGNGGVAACTRQLPGA
jgi:hypothetical protein